MTANCNISMCIAGPEVPVTVKLRMGLHPELITFLQVMCERIDGIQGWD
jgi:hypothetical protein